MTDEQAELVKKCLKKIPTLVKELGLENGYRLVINQGEDAGQTVFHLHIHILSGQKMGWTPA
jgi:diadenosine tetraphosphate (Ap4A) HIT family hydrolase